MLFTLLKAKIDYTVQGQMGLTVLRILGVLVHHISSLESRKDEDGTLRFLLLETGGQERKISE
jgi:hypothetical protein